MSQRPQLPLNSPSRAIAGVQQEQSMDRCGEPLYLSGESPAQAAAYWQRVGQRRAAGKLVSGQERPVILQMRAIRTRPQTVAESNGNAGPQRPASLCDHPRDTIKDEQP